MRFAFWPRLPAKVRASIAVNPDAPLTEWDPGFIVDDEQHTLATSLERPVDRHQPASKLRKGSAR